MLAPQRFHDFVIANLDVKQLSDPIYEAGVETPAGLEA
jgi:hypothetical protein